MLGKPFHTNNNIFQMPHSFSKDQSDYQMPLDRQEISPDENSLME